MSDLKPCPFCGCPRINEDTDLEWIYCADCGYGYNYSGAEERAEVLRHWNMRLVEDMLRGELAQQAELARMEREALIGASKEVERILRARIAELEAAARDAVAAWDWWQIDPYDRQGPGNQIYALSKLLPMPPAPEAV